MRRTALALALLVACSAPVGEAGTGIAGRIVLGPRCPVASDATPCPDEPVATGVTVRGEDGRVVATGESGEDGRFVIDVAPGRYVVEPDPVPAALFVKPVEVTVPPDGYAEVEVFLDTGIRGPAG